MEQISYSGEFTVDELAAAFRMASWGRKWLIIAYWLILAGFLASVLVGIIFNLYPVFSLFMAVYILIALGLGFYFAPATNAKKAFAQDPVIKLTGIISDEGLSIESNRTQAQLQWGIYKSARLSPGIVILYRTNNCIDNFVRKHFANEGDWKAFRSLVEQKIAKKAYFDKDPTPPRFGRYANRIIFGGLALMVILMVIISFF